MIAPGGPPSTISLVCVPHLAGNAALFADWGRHLPATIAVVPAELAGRGPRVREAPLTSVAAIGQDLAERYSAVWLWPFALYGHSMGALVAYELARTLCELGAPPAALIVGACAAPQMSRDSVSHVERSDSELIAYLAARNATPEAVLASAELAPFVLWAARADLDAWESYRWRPSSPMAVPITVVGGRDDPTVGRPDLDAWRACTSGAFRVAMIDGDHFFVTRSREALLDVVAGAVGSIGRGERTAVGQRAAAG